MLTEVTAN